MTKQLKNLFNMIICLMLTVYGYSFMSLDLSTDRIEIPLDPLTQTEQTGNQDPVLSSQTNLTSNQSASKDQSFTLTVNNTELKAYSLTIQKEIENPENDIDVLLKFDNFSLLEDGFLISDQIQVTEMEETFYQNDAPEFEINTLPMSFELNVNSPLESGEHHLSLKFQLIDEGEIAFDAEIDLVIIVDEFMKMEVFFVDSQNNELDFGLITRDITRLDREIKVKIQSNLGTPYRLIQRLGEDMKSHLSNIPFHNESLLYQVDEQNINGRAYDDRARPISTEDEIIYESSESGDNDEISILYSLNNTSRLKAGRYESRITFYIEKDQKKQSPLVSVTFDLILSVEKYFEFQVYPEKDNVWIDFTKRSMDTQIIERLLKIEILSNTGRPFFFYQILQNGLLNSKGSKIEQDQILFVQTDDKGQALNGETFKSINSQKQLLFESNESGDSEIFYIRYQFKHHPKQLAGLYRGDLEFVLSDD